MIQQTILPFKLEKRFFVFQEKNTEYNQKTYMNQRTDEWGGSLENRYRIIDEIYKKAKIVVGDYPIFIKINGYDGRKNGMRIT
jgi:hypothetical protein